ncbi:MAG: aldo/keto reductase family protein [Limnochordia bacterium]|nr:aldo/keto reductase family protein [Limnochordia bacterium]
MRYRSVGKSGLKVSEIGLGSWLTYGGYVDETTAMDCIRKAYELGINFFDTANVYHRGAAEQILGKTLRQFPRESYVLATKVFFPMGEGPNDRGLSRKHIMEQCHASLKRLRTDYIDLYQCHRYDPEVPLDETLRALDDLVTQGKVLYVGVSQWTPAQITSALGMAKTLNLHPIISNQPCYNMLQRDIESEIVPLCTQEGIGQIVYSPLAQGVLTGKYRRGKTIPTNSRATEENAKQFVQRVLTEENLLKVEKLSALAAQYDLTMIELALGWILRLPIISSAIVGARTPEQVAQNAKASGVVLPDELLTQLQTILD